MESTSKSLALSLFVLSLALAGCSKKESRVFSSLKDRTTAAQLKHFVAEKKSQAFATGAKSTPEYDAFFAAAEKGDWLAVSNGFGHLLNGRGGQRLSGSRLSTVSEVWGALDAFGEGNEKYSTLFGNDIINSIQPGSVYFGGTTPGRFTVTAMQKSQIAGDPFFTLTQNALADPTYLDYLRSMYGERIYIPTTEDAKNCAQEYTADAEQRRQNHQLKPVEDVAVDANGIPYWKGYAPVIAVNALLCKVIFDKNPDHEFYIEESTPLDWMYPYLEPHGIIFKLNHQPLATLSDVVIQQDHDCWTKYAAGMIGNWLQDDTSVNAITDFAEKAFLKNDFHSYGADPQFVESPYAHNMFSKERSSIGGLYAWRADHATDAAEKLRMTNAADFAFRQAFALCPYSPEAVYRYVQLLAEQKRWDDALLVAETADKFKVPGGGAAHYQDLIGQFKRSMAN